MVISKGGCGSAGRHGALCIAASMLLLNGSMSTAQVVLGGDVQKPGRPNTRKITLAWGSSSQEDSGGEGGGEMTVEGIQIVERGCPAPKFEQECGVDVKQRCGSTGECGGDRLCCPSLHAKLNNECSYCTEAVDCSCNNVTDFTVCGTNGKSYKSLCFLECAPTEWACNGLCPCYEDDVKLGSCPAPNGWRTESNCSNNLSCFNDKSCDLDQKCCPDYNGHIELSCGSTCQDPKIPLPCSRTKPFWLGLVQGLVTCLRLWLFHGIFSERYWFIAHAFFDALEIIFMVVDFVAQGSGFVNGIMGVNSMLETVGLVCIIYYFISALKRREEVNRQMTGQLEEQNEEQDEEQMNRAGGEIAMDGACSFIFLFRSLVVLTSSLVFLTGAVPFLVPAIVLLGLSVAMAVLLKCMHHSAVKSIPGNPKYPPFSGKAVWTFWMPFIFCFALLIIGLHGLEILGIAGWNRIRLTPTQWYMNLNVDDCNFRKFFDNGCKNRFFPPIKPKNYERHWEYIKDCGALKTWIRNRLDYLVLIFGIL